MFVHYHETWKCFLAFPTNLTNRPKCVTLEAIPHKERLATLHAICLQISRQMKQKAE